MELVVGKEYSLSDLPVGSEIIHTSPAARRLKPQPIHRIECFKVAGQPSWNGRFNHTSYVVEYTEGSWDTANTVVELVRLPSTHKQKEEEYIHEPFKRFEFSE